MSLTLDPRQRAMLEAMHIKLWQPEAEGAPKNIADSGRAAGAEAGFGSQASVPPAAPAPRAPRAPSTPNTPSPPPAPARAAPVPAPAPSVSGDLALLPPRLLYTDVDPAHTPAALGAGWLVLAEADGDAADHPLAGEAGRLLDNMLRALQLQHHPRVHHMALVRSAGGALAQGPDLQTTLAEAVAELRPALVLVMGRLAAHTLLQRREPLGQLRGQVHRLHGVPVVVSFDAPYLLRAQADKARAWADLCFALDVVGAAATAPSAGS